MISIRTICILVSLVSLVRCFILTDLLERNDEGRITCRNEFTGEELDWFTLYKLPKSNSPSNLIHTNLSDGTAYTLMTNKDQKWSFSRLNINDTQSAAGRTLAPIYSSSKDELGYILYNDQADTVTLIKGHTKGVILFDGNTAVWVVHSVPHFPPKRSDSAYKINPSQCVYGQSMLCMTFKFDELDKIGLQLLYNYPQVYDYNIPEKLLNSKATVLNNLIKVVNGERVKNQPWSNTVPLSTLGGERLLSFAKTREFEDDLYSGLVAPKLMSNLLTETWNNGAGTLKSNCSVNLPYHVNNIEEIKIDPLVPGYKFSVHHDHSKWAVTKSDNDLNDLFVDSPSLNNKNSSITSEPVRIACVGDINRQEEQFKRGGGTVCFMSNENVWRAYSQMVNEIEQCGKMRTLRWKKIKYTISGEALVLM